MKPTNDSLKGMAKAFNEFQWEAEIFMHPDDLQSYGEWSKEQGYHKQINPSYKGVFIQADPELDKGKVIFLRGDQHRDVNLEFEESKPHCGCGCEN